MIYHINSGKEVIFFFYLTGYQEPSAAAILLKTGEKIQDFKYILFVRNRDPTKEIWDGPRSGVEGAISYFGANEAYSITEFLNVLGPLLINCKTIYHDDEYSEADLIAYIQTNYSMKKYSN